MDWLKRILDLLVGIITGRAQAERAGATEAANASLQAGVETIKKANVAAAKVEHTPEAIDEDEDNLDARR